MATQRNRNETTYAPLVGYAGTQRVARFSLVYYSNRENGQIVKRESPMTMYVERYTRYKPSNNLDVSNESSVYDTQVWNYLSSQAYGRAYNKFKRLAEMPSTEVLLNIVQREKSLGMIAARLVQLKQFVTAVKRGRLGDAWNFMSLNPKASIKDMTSRGPRHFRFATEKVRQDNITKAAVWRRTLKEVGNLILEIRYGWQPLINDIAEGAKVLSDPIAEKPLKAISAQSYSYAGGLGLTHVSERVTIKGRIRIDNPNLDLANRMGLLNVPYVVWDAFPFSFLIDQVVSVGNFLKGFTDFVGLVLIEGSITARRTSFCPKSAGYRIIPGTTNNTWDPDARSVHAKKMVRVVTSSLPRPPLMLGTGLSPGRALNNVALLLQFLNPAKGASARRIDV